MSHVESPSGRQSSPRRGAPPPQQRLTELPGDGAARDRYPADESIVVRTFAGPQATEVFLSVAPDRPDDGLTRGVESAYRRARLALSAHGASLDHVVRETVFFRDIRTDREAFIAARQGATQSTEGLGTVSMHIEQPPLDDRRRFELQIWAIRPNGEDAGATTRLDEITTPDCGCQTCAEPGVRAIRMGKDRHIFAGCIYGMPGSVFEETASMFRSAQGLLGSLGTDFRSVIRTWIYLRHMERDYAEFNRARRAFFQSSGVELLPASTGIQGAPFPHDHDVAMGFYAIEPAGRLLASTLTTPTLNEAPVYGSDFSRGMRVEDGNKVALYVSGTASIDEAGRTVHLGDIDGQVDRMLLNIATLLDRQGASFEDVVSAITYVKHRDQAGRVRKILAERGLDGIPNPQVEAQVCRPDLLCEMEAIAVLPRPGTLAAE